MTRFVWIFILSLGLLACKGTKEATDSANVASTSVPQDFSLTVERSACMGTCPAYMFHVQADGQVFYEGYSNVPLTGKHTKKISEEKLNMLIAALNKADFWNLEERYDNPNLSDMPSTKMTATVDGQTHSVVDRFETPEKVINLSVELDEIVGMDGFEPFEPEK